MTHPYGEILERCDTTAFITALATVAAARSDETAKQAQPAGRQNGAVRQSPRLPLGYQTGDRCDQCGRSHFYIDRTTATCAFCGMPAPLADATLSPPGRWLRERVAVAA